jgi:hypothetical protein
MKIINIKKFDVEKILVEVEGYPHAQPVFDANITAKDLEIKLKEWKVNQDECDRINAENLATVKPVLEIKKELTNLINKNI